MSFSERFKEQHKADAESILEENLDRARGLFRYHEDGSIQISDGVRSASGPIVVLVYLIAKRMMFEAGEAESPALTNEYFYGKLDAADSSIRRYIMDLRDDGRAKTNSGEHKAVAENLPMAFDRIEAVVDKGGDA